MKDKDIYRLINRRYFIGKCLPAMAMTTFMSNSQAQSARFYTPPVDLLGQWQFTSDPALPNVLLIGDSISVGYTLDVRTILTGKANVFRPMARNERPANCGNTNSGLEHLSNWLGSTNWSVIHFNWGLWDLCYRSPQSRFSGHRDKIHGIQDVPIAKYEENLTKLVGELISTKARLIWASTTVVPPDEPGRFVGDEVKYNRVAKAIMERNHIQVDNLYSLTAQFPVTDFQAHGNVHYTKSAYERIAYQVAGAICTAMDDKRSL